MQGFLWQLEPNAPWALANLLGFALGAPSGARSSRPASLKLEVGACTTRLRKRVAVFCAALSCVSAPVISQLFTPKVRPAARPELTRPAPCAHVVPCLTMCRLLSNQCNRRWVAGRRLIMQYLSTKDLLHALHPAQARPKMSEEMAETKPKVEEPAAPISIKVKDQDGGEVGWGCSQHALL
jgi:hypothetical protein